MEDRPGRTALAKAYGTGLVQEIMLQHDVKMHCIFTSYGK